MENLCEEIWTWPERDQRTPSLVVDPGTLLDSELAGAAIEKAHAGFVLLSDGASASPGTTHFPRRRVLPIAVEQALQIDLANSALVREFCNGMSVNEPFRVTVGDFG